MNRVLYQNRCRCNEDEEFFITKKRKSISRSERKPFPYPTTNEITSQTFQIRYEKKLSPIGKSILNSFQKKYIYYAIDDILYLLKANLEEQENLLAILYSPILSLQNNFSINFFDIWIHEIYIEEISNVNKFLKDNFQISNPISYITIKLFYKTRIPVKKQESLW
jgi:hypothetical protein